MVTNQRAPSATFNLYRHMFGSDQGSCRRGWEEEQRAYYALIPTRDIISTLNATREYVPLSDTLEQSSVWLETVTLA